MQLALKYLRVDNIDAKNGITFSNIIMKITSTHENRFNKLTISIHYMSIIIRCNSQKC